MDEYFDYFLRKMGPASDRRYVPPSTIEYYRGRLPDRLLSYWEEYGWCGYSDGRFWTVNPQEYEPVLEAWIGDTPFMEQDSYHVIARSAFGKLLFWGERSGCSLEIQPWDALAFPSKAATEYIVEGRAEEAVSWFFAGLRPEYFDTVDDEGQQLFDVVRKKLGSLKSDELYGFVPAVALSGAATLANLQKVKAIEHLVVLAQFAELRVMHSPFR
jgi:hypothetical protein